LVSRTRFSIRSAAADPLIDNTVSIKSFLESPKSTESNVIASFGANIWSALLSLLLVPVYVRYIGIEAYGLIGLFGSIQALSSLLDMGLSTTMNREMARASTDPDYRGQARRLVRTLEWVYWGLGITLGLALLSIVPFLADHWVNTVHLTRGTVRAALLLISATTVLQWPFSFYSGGLLGLQRQALLSMLQAGCYTLRGVGAVLILSRVSPTIEAFFAWQVAVSGLSTLLAAVSLWRCLPLGGQPPQFDPVQLRRVWRFAAGITAISALGVALMQTDKVLLSRILTLEQFGYYTLAGVVPAGLYMVVNPIYNVMFPRLTQLVARGVEDDIRRFYHQSSQLMGVALIPLVVILATFPREVIFVWTGNPLTAEKTWVIVALLASGTGLHGMSHIPWALQLAHGWTRLSFWTNLVSVLILFPLTIALAFRYGPIGGAATWLILNVGVILFTLPVMHRRVLRGELLRWYCVDLGAPLVASLAVALPFRFVIHGQQPRTDLLLLLVLSGITAFSAAMASVETTRTLVLSEYRRLTGAI